MGSKLYSLLVRFEMSCVLPPCGGLVHLQFAIWKPRTDWDYFASRLWWWMTLERFSGSFTTLLVSFISNNSQEDFFFLKKKTQRSRSLCGKLLLFLLLPLYGVCVYMHAWDGRMSGCGFIPGLGWVWCETWDQKGYVWATFGVGRRIKESTLTSLAIHRNHKLSAPWFHCVIGSQLWGVKAVSRSSYMCDGDTALCSRDSILWKMP